MTEPLGLAQVEAKILELVDLLEQCTHAQRKRWEADAAADAGYDIAFAQAFLQAKEGVLPGQEKPDSDLTAKQRATVLTGELLSSRNSAHALLESAREAARNYRSALDGLRSINTNVRELDDAMTAYPKSKVKRAKGRARPDEPLAPYCEVGRVGVCTGLPSHRHHRLQRSQGGSDDRANTLDVCTACHRLIHDRPSLAYAHGWLLHGGAA